MPLLFFLYIENGTYFTLLNWLRELLLRGGSHATCWAEAQDPTRPHRGLNTRGGFIYSISNMEKSLYTKEILHFPVFPLKEVTCSHQALEVQLIQHPVLLARPYQVWIVAKPLSSTETSYTSHYDLQMTSLSTKTTPISLWCSERNWNAQALPLRWDAQTWIETSVDVCWRRFRFWCKHMQVHGLWFRN